MTTPGIGLVAATLSIKISVLLKKEVQIPIMKEIFWPTVKLYLNKSKLKLRDPRLNLSKSPQVNVSDFTSAQNRILQVMLQGSLAHAIKEELKNGFLVQR